MHNIQCFNFRNTYKTKHVECKLAMRVTIAKSHAKKEHKAGFQPTDYVDDLNYYYSAINTASSSFMRAITQKDKPFRELLYAYTTCINELFVYNRASGWKTIFTTISWTFRLCLNVAYSYTNDLIPKGYLLHQVYSERILSSFVEPRFFVAK